MKNLMKASLVLLNGIMFATLVAGTPASATASEPFKRDCCQHSTEGTGFCCNECCWFTKDCTFGSECADIIQT